MRGDDAAGVCVARQLAAALRDILRPQGNMATLVINAGSAPENFTGPLRHFGPDLVLLIDAAQMDALPGSVQWLLWQETSGLSASTHTLPPYILATYLVSEIGCEVALLGIQPADTSLGIPLSPLVHSAVDAVVRELQQVCLGG